MSTSFARVPPNVRPLPAQVELLLDHLEAPPRLVTHLALVHTVAQRLIEQIDTDLPGLRLDREAVRLGAALHDVGKVLVPEELEVPGGLHEVAGERLLLERAFAPAVARFARTHGAPDGLHALAVEDLLVVLADTVWKGARWPDLDDALAAALAAQLDVDRWIAYAALDDAIAEASLDAADLLAWYAATPVR